MGFIKDNDPRKVNLGIGAYRDGEGKPVVMKAVQTAEKMIVSNTTYNKEYLPMSGYMVSLD